MIRCIWPRDPVRVKIVEDVGVRTFLTVPLVKDGVAFGCLNLNRNEVKPFADDEIALIETFAEQAVIAIENVRQFREIADSGWNGKRQRGRCCR